MRSASAKHILWQSLLVSLLVGVVTMKELDALVMPGLDQPFRWALNYLLAHDPAELADISYTVGPLCLLKWPVAMGDHILISSLFYIFLNTVFTYLFISFYTQRQKVADVIKPALMAMVWLLLVEIDYVFIGLVAVAAMQYRFNEDKRAVWIALFFTVAGMYLKTSLIMYLLSIWWIFSVYLLYRKEYRYFLTILWVGICMYLLAGLILFRGFEGVLNYSVNNVQMAFEYADSLSLYPHNNWKMLGLSLLSLFMLVFVYLRQPAGYVWAILAFCFFANWKYAMGREDFWHAITFIYIIALALLLFLAVQKEKKFIGLLLFIVAISAYASNLKYLYNYNNYVFWVPDMKNFDERVWHHEQYKQKMLADSKYLCAPNILPDSIKQELKDASVDVFPFDLSYVMINDLLYRPRPSLQSGFFGVRNDMLDAAHLHSGRAPQYLIWHSFSDGKSQVDGLEGLYLPNTNPQTIDAIYACYEPTTFSNDKYTIWKKRSKQLVKNEAVTGVVSTVWNDWINLPPTDSNTILRVSVKIGYTTGYKLRSLLYKGLPLYIEYRTDNNIYRYRFTKDLAMSGILAGPLLKDTHGTTEQVRQVRFINDRPGEGYFDGTLQLEWHVISYR